MAVGREGGLQLDSRRCGRVCTRSDEAVRLLVGIRGDHGDVGMGSEDGCWGWGSISTHQLALSMHPERRGPVHWLCDDSKRNAATAKAWVDELERAEFSWAAANHSHTLAWCLPCPSAACPGAQVAASSRAVGGIWASGHLGYWAGVVDSRASAAACTAAETLPRSVQGSASGAL